MSDNHDLDRTIGRVLGPAEEELGCEACFELLDRYVELELVGEDADAAVPGLRAHLEGCPACREEHDSLYALARGDRAR
jgi:predicted anti-sigma-YlaC factor YlaD